MRSSDDAKLENPYAAPGPAPPAQLASGPGLSTLFWSILAVFGSTLLGGALGAVVGAALGAFVPGYYRSVMPRGDSPGFDPVAVGLGLGLSQGMVFGAVVGLALVAMFYRHRASVAKQRSAA